MFKRISNSQDHIPVELFINWLEKYGNKTFKPLINLNIKLNPLFGENNEPSENSPANIPLILKKLIEEVNNYGTKYIRESFQQFVTETMENLDKTKQFPKGIKLISLTNLQKFFASLNLGNTVEDIHELKNWLLDNQLAERQVILVNNEVDIEIIINSDNLWEAFLNLFTENSVQFKNSLVGTTSEELLRSIRDHILKKKLQSIHKVFFK